MKVAVMQPYFLPYIGYFQLMACVDKFIIFDDVNFINRGWINRNRLLIDGKEKFFTIPLKGASQNRRINEIEVINDLPWPHKLLRTIEQAYGRKRHFPEIFPLVSAAIICPEQNLAKFVSHALVAVSSFLDIKCKIIMTSTIYENVQLKGEERILDICQQERASTYVNLPGGRELYDRTRFSEAGIELQFVRPIQIEYEQGHDAFIPWLSILDVLMCSGKKRTSEMLKSVELE